MQFAGTSYLAIFVAAIVAFVIGALYYGILRKPWMKAAKIDPDGVKGPSPSLLITIFVVELVMAFVTAGVIGHLGHGQVTLYNGVITALFIWAGFILTTITINHRSQGIGWDLTIIDSLHWLLVMLGIGATIGLIGV